MEGICTAQKITGGPVDIKRKDGTTAPQKKSNLEGKISGLCESGVLTKAHAAFLHQHSFLGNEALHELRQPSSDELALAIEILEHTLEALYKLPGMTEELRKSTARRKAKPRP